MSLIATWPESKGPERAAEFLEEYLYGTKVEMSKEGSQFTFKRASDGKQLDYGIELKRGRYQLRSKQ